MPSGGQPPNTPNARYLALRGTGARLNTRSERAAARQRRLVRLDRLGADIAAVPATGPDVTHLATFLIHATLPYKDPGENVHVWRRSYNDGDATVTVTFQSGITLDAAGREHNLGLPFGVYPRLITADLCNRIIQDKNPANLSYRLGDTLSDWIRDSLRLPPSGGERGTYTRVREQIIRLLKTSLHVHPDGSTNGQLNLLNGQLFMIEADQNIWDSTSAASLREADLVKYLKHLRNPTIRINPAFAAATRRLATPFDLRIETILARYRSPLAIDLSRLITLIQFHLQKARSVAPEVYGWKELGMLLGHGNHHSGELPRAVAHALELIAPLYPGMNAEARSEGLIIRPGRTQIPIREKSRRTLAAASRPIAPTDSGT